MKHTAVLTAAFPPLARDLLAAADLDVVEHPTEHERSEDELITILSEADAAITLLSDPLTRRVLAANPNLRTSTGCPSRTFALVVSAPSSCNE